MLSSTNNNNIDRTTNILKGGPEHVNYEDGCLSLGQLFLKRLAQHGDTILMIDGVTGEKVSSVQIRNRSIQFAKCLFAIGVRAGDTVGVFTLNRMEFAYVMIGSFLCGATVAPLNVTYTSNEIQHAVNLSRPKIIFSGPENQERIRELQKTHSYVAKVISFGDEFNRFVKNFKGDSNENFRSEPQNISDNVALILCSSGTTGLPKGVQLTQKNVMIGIEQQANRSTIVAPDPIILSIIPWFHSFGCLTLICSSANGQTIVFLPKFEENAFLRAIEENKVNVLLMVPPLMVFLAKSPLVDNFDLSSLQVIFCGAAPLSKESEDAVQKRLGIPIIIRQGYGMTEGTLAFTGQTDEHHSSGSVGVLMNGLMARIVDETTGENLPAFKRGEVWIKGSILMKGYVNDEEATKRTIDKDGWLHTGDIGYYNNDGELFIVDRLKELIKYNGFQVPPAEIEGLLLQHPKIADAGVVGKPDERVGEMPLAFVVRQRNVELTEKEVVDFVAERVSPAKRLHGGVIFLDAIPKSPSGKILRRELRGLLNIIRSKL